jgi:hypothetical protein
MDCCGVGGLVFGDGLDSPRPLLLHKWNAEISRSDQWMQWKMLRARLVVKFFAK